jgi:hypothetical protein
MDDPGLSAMFGAALGLVPPWRVTSVVFDKEAGKLRIGLDFPCPWLTVRLSPRGLWKLVPLCVNLQ